MQIEADDGDSDNNAAESRPDSEGIEVVEDDPETVWGLWDSATEENESRFGEIHSSEFNSVLIRDKQMDGSSNNLSSVASDAEDLDRKIIDAFLFVANQQPDIANTVRSLWGTEDCRVHINKLIVEGVYQNGGLAMDIAEALLELADLHDAKFASQEGALDLDLDLG